MDPCPFVRILIGGLALKFPSSSSSSSSSSSYYCKIKLKTQQTQFSEIPLFSEDANHVDDHTHCSFTFKKSDFQKLVERSSPTKKGARLKIEVFSGRLGKATCGFGSSKLIGRVTLGLETKGLVEGRGCVLRNGWVEIGEQGSKGCQLHVNLMVEPDPRFVFEFDGEPECSPQVFQVNGSQRQAVFTCKFGFRNFGDQNLRSRSSLSGSTTPRSWLGSLRSVKEKPLRERKGWTVTIHDLSGSPVAAASMVTPFVPSPGTNQVSRSNPGAWLILRPGHGTWTPWGRLEAWRETKGGDRLGYRFELLSQAVLGGVDSITLSESTLSTRVGGSFAIDISSCGSAITTPSGSFDSGSGSVSGSEAGPGPWAQLLFNGFVMSSMVARGGGGRGGKPPQLEVGAQHVTCKEDAAAFVALAAAVDLSVDACTPFSRKLRKELREDRDE